MVLGQDQDSYGGGFQSAQSLIGQMEDDHLFNYVKLVLKASLEIKGISTGSESSIGYVTISLYYFVIILMVIICWNGGVVNAEYWKEFLE